MKCVAGKRTRVLAILCLLLFLSPGCNTKAKPSLTLKVSSLPLSPDEEVQLILENPGKRSLFVPVDWLGIEMFRQESDGKWLEYKKHNETSRMFSTAMDRLVYSIPPGTLVPGKYKLVIRGRLGKDGSLISLGTDLDLKSFSNTQPSGL